MLRDWTVQDRKASSTPVNSMLRQGQLAGNCHANAGELAQLPAWDGPVQTVC